MQVTISNEKILFVASQERSLIEYEIQDLSGAPTVAKKQRRGTYEAMANRGHEEADLGGQDYLKKKNEYKPICEEFIIRKGLN